MVKYKKILIILFITLLLIPSFTVLAAGGDKPPNIGEKVECTENVCPAPESWQGVAQGKGSNETGTSNYKVDLRKCGEEGKICFGGEGIYLNLVKYDSVSKTETYVGNPVLLYTDGFLATRTSLFNGEIDGADGPYNTSFLQISYFYSTPSVLVRYPSDNISFSPRGGVDYNYLKKINIGDTKLVNENGYADYVNSYIAKLVNDAYDKYRNQGLSDEERPIVIIADLFDYGTEMRKPENLREVDKYYIAVDVAERNMSTPIDKWAIDGDTTKVNFAMCNPSNCKYTWIHVEKPVTVYTKAYCPVTGNTYQCEGFSGSGDHSKEYCNEWNTKNVHSCSKVSSSLNFATYNSTVSVSSDYPAECDREHSSEEGKTYRKYSSTTWKCPIEGNTNTYYKSDDCATECVQEITNDDGTTTEKKVSCNAHYHYIEKTCKVEIGDFNIGGAGLLGWFGTVQVYTWRPDYVFTYGTSVKRARDTGNKRLSLRIYEAVEEGTKHAVLAKDGITPTGRYEYYVGPNAKDAIVGITPYNKYQLVGNDKTIESITKTDILSKKYTIGVAYFWLPSFEPLDTCKSICKSKSGDRNELLKCAENFCDNAIGYQESWPVNKQKRNCIIQCGYEPKPNNCKANGVMFEEKTKIENTVNNCVETWCHNDSNEDNPDQNIPIDQKTYVHMGCSLGITGIDFTGPDEKSVLPGIGVDYRLKLKREKKCLIWFDEETWKLDYASLHSKDKVCMNNDCTDNKASRDLLIKILNDYNAAANGNYSGEIGGSISSYFDNSERDTHVQWKHTNLDITDINGNDVASTSVIISEKTEDRKLVDNVEKSLVKTNEEINNSYTAQVSSFVVGFSRLNSTNAIKVNSYLTKSSITETFGFEKTCVSTDGKGTTYQADGSGVCYKNRDKEPGKNAYYTSVLGMASKSYEFNIVAKTQVKDSGKNPSTEPTLNKVCEQALKVKPTLGCNISVEANSGTTLIDGGIYNGPNGVSASLANSSNLSNDSIQYYGLFLDPTNDDWKNYDGKTAKLDSIKPKGTSGIEEHKIYCMVKTKGGLIGYGEETVKLTNCNNTKCTIVKKEDNKYEISVNNKSASVSVTTDDSPYNKLSVYLNDNKFEFTLKTGKTNNVKAIVATVKDSSGTSCCILSSNETVSCTAWNAKKDHTFTQVNDWCKENYEKDIAGYKTPTSCTEKCYPCPFVEECGNDTIDLVTNYCRTASNGDKTFARSCLSTCYKKVCSDDVIYRPIDVHNPFPNSPVSPVDKGNRVIGANWVGFTEFITDDLDDPTSLTGPNKGSEAEYIIDLTPDDIRKIREDNNKKGSLDSYTELIYSTDLDDDYQGKYRSSFVHDDDKNNGGFASIFSKMPG